MLIELSISSVVAGCVGYFVSARRFHDAIEDAARLITEEKNFALTEAKNAQLVLEASKDAAAIIENERRKSRQEIDDLKRELHSNAQYIQRKMREARKDGYEQAKQEFIEKKPEQCPECKGLTKLVKKGTKTKVAIKCNFCDDGVVYRTVIKKG